MTTKTSHQKKPLLPAWLSTVPLSAAASVCVVILALTQWAGLALAQNKISTSEGVEQQRIVSLGGVITEILYALGKEQLIVAVDTTSLFPAQALKDKPNVGYVRALSAEGVLSTKPSLVIAIDGAGPPDAIKQLTEAGIRMARVPDEASEAGVIAKITAVSQLVDRNGAAPAMIEKIRSSFTTLSAERERIAKPRRILFVLALQNGRPLVGGRNSAADAIIRLAGGINAASEVDGYKPMTDEAVIAAAPDVVLMMNRGDHATPASDVFALPAFSGTPAAANKRLIAMDGLYLLGFGPRTPDAARDLMAAIYPELKLAGVPKQ